MKHQNLFVTIVGVAAWVHSTWSFSTVIGGEVPAIASLIDIPRWLYWILPGAAAAAAVDVGLISLAAQFRTGRGNRAKLVTFAVLSFISYLGQALFSLSHGGRYVPSVGLSDASITVASIVWEVLIWLLPAALPVTLILWAWSDMTPNTPNHTPIETTALTVIHSKNDSVVFPVAESNKQENDPQNDETTLPVIEPQKQENEIESESTTVIFTLECPDCTFVAQGASQTKAQMALRGHKKVHNPNKIISAAVLA